LNDATSPPASSGQGPFLSPGVERPSAQHFSWLSPAAFWLPGWNFSSARAESLPFLFWLVDAARPRLIVDLAAGRPDRYLAFCQAVERLGYGGKCLGLAGIFDRRSENRTSLGEFHDLHFGHLSSLKKDPTQIIDSLGGQTVDLLCIDNKHASQFSEHEAHAWLGRLSPDGFILVEQPEQLEQWPEFLGNRASFRFNGKHNFRLIAASPPRDGKLAPLFAKSSGTADTDAIEAAFTRLGSALREHALSRDTASFSARLEISLADQSAMADMLREEKSELEAAIQQQMAERNAHLARIAVLEPHVEQFRAEVIRLQVHAHQVQQEISRLEGQLQQQTSERDADIERLETAIEERDEAKRKTEAELTRLRHIVANREGKLSAANETVNDLRRHVSHLEHDLDRIVHSTAWKITAPIRWFFQRHPAVARAVRRLLKLVWWTVTLQLFARLKQWRGSGRYFSARLATNVAPAVPVHVLDGSLHAVPSLPDSESNLPSRQPLPDAGLSSAQLQNIENRMVELSTIVNLERQRVDYALLGADGMLNEIELYNSARRQPEYNKVFEAANPLVSICVATMNRPDLLIDRCLKSLLNQTYRNIQIIVVGDHCTDDTGSRIARLGDDRISFHNLPERGPYPQPGIDRWRVAGTNAINAALSMCEGQFIAHLDDDDSSAADRIETLVNAALEHKADFCWHSFWCERKGGTWFKLGDGRFELGQITTGSIFYHQYFKRIPWDVFSYRVQEPGDWNRLRKIRMLRPNLHFVDRPLLYHYTEGNQPPFVRRNGESFLK
jgi:hypothetical protein